MRLYLSGPMSGIEDYNRPAFVATARALRHHGYTVVSPVELDEGTDLDLTPDAGWKCDESVYWKLIRRDIARIMECDALALMPGWEDSRGCRLELAAAGLAKLDSYLVKWSGFRNLLMALPQNADALYLEWRQPFTGSRAELVH